VFFDVLEPVTYGKLPETKYLTNDQLTQSVQFVLFGFSSEEFPFIEEAKKRKSSKCLSISSLPDRD
jgi:hypothetical protein